MLLVSNDAEKLQIQLKLSRFPRLSMPRTVNCVVTKEEGEGLDAPPYPGPLGQRIFKNVSKEGWKLWLERLVTIINENQLTTGDSDTQKLIEQHLLGFVFGEGDLGQLPQGFTTNRKK